MSDMGKARRDTFFRDGGCVAPMLDRSAGLCHDEWGELLVVNATTDYEWDYVRTAAEGKRHELAGDHVQVCAGHHRGAGPSAGYQWATAHRALLREYLDECAKVVPAKRRLRGWGRAIGAIEGGFFYDLDE